MSVSINEGFFFTGGCFGGFAGAVTGSFAGFCGGAVGFAASIGGSTTTGFVTGGGGAGGGGGSGIGCAAAAGAGAVAFSLSPPPRSFTNATRPPASSADAAIAIANVR